MTKFLKLLLATLLLPMTIAAQGWDDSEYHRIESNIHEPQFASRDFPITKYGAKQKTTPANNQKAINNAIAA